jgi:PEP-CTERM motif
MRLKIALLALAGGLTAAVTSGANADVIYKADNPARHFTLFVYDSPGFITTDTVVPVADLAYFAPPPLNFISSVEFIPSSSDLAHLGLPEVAVFQYSGGPPQSFTGDQFRWYPLGTFTHYGVTPGLAGSFGFPSSQLVVAAPEPSTMGLVAAGLLGVLALRRRGRSSRG